MTENLSATLSLNGSDWECKPFYGLDWRLRSAHLPGRDALGWLPATVPGSALQDLWAAGEVPDPYADRNSLACEWASDRTWVYRRTFAVPMDWRGRRVTLRFEGVDYAAQFFLNGERLGEHVGMYTPVEFDVADLLQNGVDNHLAVVIEPAPVEQPQIGLSDRVRTHKSRMTYWWDFCPRLVHLGIWDGVSLVATGPARLADVWVRPELSENLSRADVSVAIALDAGQGTDLDLALSLDGVEIARQQVRTEGPQASAHFILEHPAPWWPNGHGDQPLYTLTVRALDPESGAESDVRAVMFGVRRLRFVPNEGVDPAALPYAAEVNGRKIYLKGWNWVPIDMLYGTERPAKLERLLRLAQRAHVNLLRVWGGGLIEKEAFYDLCDRLGIMVWQEFIQSSSGIDNTPPSDPDFLAWLEREARQIVPRRRNHPALAVWCGGNELSAATGEPCDERHPNLAMLRRVVDEMDPGRPWLPTSPSGPVFANSLAEIARDPQAQHDVHGPWEHQGLTGQYTLFNAATSLLHSEFGAEGITNLRTLEATVSPALREPVTLRNPLWLHRGAWWVKEGPWRESLGELGSLEALVQGTQFLQAESVRYAVEANRRRKYHNSGSLPWQFNEPYPMSACTSAVDYFAQPKPLYYAVAREYAPRLVAARFTTLSWADRATFEADLWAANSYPEACAATLRARLVGVDGEEYAALEPFVTLTGNGVTPLATLQHPLDSVADLFFLDLTLADENGAPLAANRYLFTRQPNLAQAWQQPAASPEVAVDRAAGRDAWRVTLANPSPHAALGVWLEDARPRGSESYAYFGDNYFHLLPGETRVIDVTWDGVRPAERQVEISGWNVAPLTSPPDPLSN